MTDDVRNLIRFVVDGDIRNAQTQCRIMLEKNVPEKDARFKENELRKLNLLKPELIQLPANLENLLIAEDATNFPESRFLLREEEETVINKLLATRKAALAIKELGIHYTCSLLLTGLPGVGKTELAQLSRVDIEKVLTYIRTNAKTFRQKLRKLYITQQKKQIDVKKTIEKSVQCDGEIARLYYKKPIKSKANVVMLADISGSCRAMTSLALTYMGLMREVFPGGCHLFVFVNHLVPVDRYFSNENVTAAVESINKNVPSRGIYSNYGVPLKELRYDNTGIINKDTTIVMLGDCRNNRNYSGVEDVEWLSKRASNFFVLNPEPRDEWGQGDSIADLYAKSGAVVSQVSSAKDLLNFLQSAGTTRHL